MTFKSTKVYIVSLAIELVGNKNFCKYFWRIAKEYFLNITELVKLKSEFKN